MAIARLLVRATAAASPSLHMSRRGSARLAHSIPVAFCIVCPLACRSWSEYQAPTKCVVEEACPGYTNVPGSGATNFADTQTCSAGYESTRCGTCSAGYYQLNSRCYFCGSSVDQSATIATTVIIGISVMSLLALAASTLSSLKLAQAIQIFSLLQGAAAVGVAGARSSPYFGEQLHEGMTYANFSRVHKYAQMQFDPGLQLAHLLCSFVLLHLFSHSQFRHRGDQTWLWGRANLHVRQEAAVHIAAHVLLGAAVRPRVPDAPVPACASSDSLGCTSKR